MLEDDGAGSAMSVNVCSILTGELERTAFAFFSTVESSALSMCSSLWIHLFQKAINMSSLLIISEYYEELWDACTFFDFELSFLQQMK